MITMTPRQSAVLTELCELAPDKGLPVTSGTSGPIAVLQLKGLVSVSGGVVQATTLGRLLAGLNKELSARIARAS